MQKKFLFYHIPRTGGTSFDHLISTIYDKQQFVNLNNNPKYAPENYLETPFISGHFNNLPKAEKFWENRYKIVILRDPVQRFISQYYHTRNKNKSATDPSVNKTKTGKIQALINKILGKPGISELEAYVDLQTEFVADHILNRQVCMLSDTGSGDPYEQLEQAKVNLQKFDFIALTERIDQSVKLLTYVAGWPQRELEQKNVGKIQNQDINDRVLEKIKKLNRCDIELYEFAKKLYDQQEIRIIDSIIKEMNDLRELNKQYQVNAQYKKILYYHIPKSAGTALFEAFRAYFGEQSVIQFPNDTNFTPRKIREYQDIQILGGHFKGFIEAEKLLSKRYSIIILRDPVERFISQYFYYKYTVPDTVEDKSVKVSKEKDLEDFVTYYEQLPPQVDSYRNRQVSHLKNKIAFSDSPDEMLAQAKRNLEKFDLIGLYERLDECVATMREDIGLDESFVLPQANVTKNKKEIDPALKSRIRALNKLDYELYEYAQELIEKKSRARAGSASQVAEQPAQ